MRAPISVVVPVPDEAEALAEGLSALGEGLAAGLIRELLVCGVGGMGDVRSLADAAGAEWIAGGLPEGCAAARGDWLLIVPVGAALPPGWADRALRVLTGAGAAYVLGPRGWLCRLLRRAGPGDVVLVPRALWQARGGTSEGLRGLVRSLPPR